MRIASGVLWLFAGWYIGNLLAYHAGWSMLFGPVLGIAAAVIVAGDPLGLLWKRAASRAAAEAAASGAVVDGAAGSAD